MNQLSPDLNQNNHVQDSASIADELKRESERLGQLAEELKKREELQAEMQANYPIFKRFVYEVLKERSERELPPLPEGKSLEEIAIEENAQPFEAILTKLEQMKDRFTDAG